MVQEQPNQSDLSGVSWRFHSLALLAIFALGAIAYSNTFSVPFVFDDTPNIVEEPQIRVTKLGKLHEAVFGNHCPRPVAYLSLALNYYFGGYDVTGYHLVNLAIHIINGLLVYCLALRTYHLFFCKVRPQIIPNDTTFPNDKALGCLALFAGALFVVHPVQIQAVTYVVQRMTSLASLFYLLSLLLYIQGRICQHNKKKWFFWVGSIVSVVLSLGAKQNAATLPIAIMLYEWYFFQNLNWGWAKRRLKVLIGIGVAVGLVALIFLGDSPWQQILAGYDRRDFTLGERVLTQFRVLVIYLSLILLPLPSRMNLLHHISTSHGLLDPISTLFSLVTLLGLAGAAVYWARSQRLLSFAIVWFFLHLAIESSVIGLEMIFEHRLYLPMFGVALFVPYLIYELLAKRVVLARTLAVLLLVSLSLGTYLRNADWQDEVTLWSDVIAKNPVAKRAFLARGDAFGEAGEHQRALADYAKAIELDPDYPNTFLNRGKYYLQRGQDRQALSDVSQAIRLDPDFQRAFMSRGEIYTGQGRLDLAVKDYTRAMELAPGLASPYNNRAIAYGQQGMQELALQDFARAIELDANNGQAYFNRGSFYRNLGKFELAVEDYTQAIVHEPEVAGAYMGRGSCFENLNQHAEAVADYTQAIALGADLVPANKRLAWLLASSADETIRDGEKAVEYATRACGLADWEAPNCLEALAAAYAELGEFSLATKWQTKAIELAGDRTQPVMLERLGLYREGKAYRIYLPQRTQRARR